MKRRPAVAALVMMGALAACSPTAPTPSVVLALDPNPVMTLPSTVPCPRERTCTTVLIHAPWTLILTSNVALTVDGVEARVFQLDDGATLGTRSFSAADVTRAAGASHLSARASLPVPLGISFEIPIGPYRSRVIEVTAIVSPDGAPALRETIRAPVH